MTRRDPQGRELPPRLYFRGKSYYRVHAEGSRRLWTNLGQDYTSALKRWAELEGGRLAPAETLRDVAVAYEHDAEGLLRLSVEGQRSYRRALGRLLPVFGHMRLDEIQPSDVAEYRRRRSAPVAANREMTLLGCLFRYARAAGWWHSTDAPSDGIRRNRETPRRRVATPEEIARLLLAARPLWARIVEFALLTGARGGEIRVLRRDAITERGIVLKRTKTGTESLIRWSEALRATVDGALALQPARVRSLFVFPSRGGGAFKYSAWHTAWRRLCERAEVEGLRFHDLRRTAATAAADLEHARVLLGHSTQKITGRVYRVRDEVEPTR